MLITVSVRRFYALIPHASLLQHRIQHLAFAFDKTESDDSHIVKEADVTCLLLY